MIFANGCSFTYGYELDTPFNKAWPYILAKKLLNCSVANFGENNSDNQRILQTTIDFFKMRPGSRIWLDGQTHITIDDGYLPRYAIIQWTTYIRFNSTWDFNQDIVLNGNPEEYLLDKYFIQVKVMQDFFESREIPYLMFNGFDNEKVIPNSTSKFKDLINTKYFIGWPDESVVNWVYGMPHKPKGHPGEEAHVRIAEIVYENIRDKLRLP